MSAPRKPGKADLLRDSLRRPTETAESSAPAASVDYGRYRKSTQATVSFRLDTIIRDRLEAYAEDRGLKLAQVLRSWILERAQREGLK